MFSEEGEELLVNLRSVTITLGSLFILVASALSAQVKRERIREIVAPQDSYVVSDVVLGAAGSPRKQGSIAPTAYGTTSLTRVWRPASSFVERDHYGSYTDHKTMTYGLDVYRVNSEGTYVIPLGAPVGSQLYSVELFYWDYDSGRDITLKVRSGRAVNGEPPIVSTDVILSTSGASYNYRITTVSGGEYNLIDIVDANRIYWIEVTLPPSLSDAELSFGGVAVSYRLQISDAPTTATFADVPTSSQFFQHVEALKASGITTGCGTIDPGTGKPNYCPSEYVTRAQMAAFLARALGLHWAN